MKILLVIYLSLKYALASSVSIPKCLFKKELYHEETQTCFPPLEQGPCPVGQWLVLNSTSSTGVCMDQFDCDSGQLPVLDHGGGAVCGCPEGQEIFLVHVKLFTPRVCVERVGFFFQRAFMLGIRYVQLSFHIEAVTPARPSSKQRLKYPEEEQTEE